jgi:DMSO/TMAO reductase YedYZ molybdopterin-dependent catalytic subunit
MRIAMRIIDRRAFLQAGATLVGARLLAGCDTLELPEGLPPDALDPITPNDEFYVTSIGRPEVDRATWTLVIADNDVVLATIDADTLDGLTPRDTERTLECIGSSESNQAIGNAIWSGLPLPELLATLGVTLRADALEIVMTGADGYRTPLPRTDVDRPMWLVWRMNGEDLPVAHGFPARLLSPGRYGTKNVKWLTRLDLVDEPFVGFWEARGWSNDATYKANTFIIAPDSQTEVEGGALFLGNAFAGEDPVTRVQISTDGGATWEDAELTYEGGPGVWVQWRYDWVAEPGDYEVIARCTTASGATSNDNGGGSLDGYDASMSIQITVR